MLQIQITLDAEQLSGEPEADRQDVGGSSDLRLPRASSFPAFPQLLLWHAPCHHSIIHPYTHPLPRTETASTLLTSSRISSVVPFRTRSAETYWLDRQARSLVASRHCKVSSSTGHPPLPLVLQSCRLLQVTPNAQGPPFPGGQASGESRQALDGSGRHHGDRSIDPGKVCIGASRRPQPRDTAGEYSFCLST